VPIFFVFTVAFLWRDIIRAWHYLQKKTVLARLVRGFELVFFFWQDTNDVTVGQYTNLILICNCVRVDRITSRTLGRSHFPTPGRCGVWIGRTNGHAYGLPHKNFATVYAFCSHSHDVVYLSVTSISHDVSLCTLALGLDRDQLSTPQGLLKPGPNSRIYNILLLLGIIFSMIQIVRIGRYSAFLLGSLSLAAGPKDACPTVAYG